MTHEHVNSEIKPSWTPILLSMGILVCAGLSFHSGWISANHQIQKEIDNFSMFEVNDHIYQVELIRAPYEPETVTLEELGDFKASRKPTNDATTHGG